MVKPHEIPTHLNVEDKLLLGLTVRQTLNLMAGVSGTYGMWNQWPDMPALPRWSMIAASLILTLAFTLVRIQGRGLDEWAFVLLHYTGTPKALVWRPAAADRPAASSTQGLWEELNPHLSWEVTK